MSNRLPINRNKVQRAFKMRGLSIRLDACDAAIVTKQILTVVVSELSKDSQDIMAESVQLLGAFETPRLAYDSMRKEFTLLRNEERSLHAEAEHKIDMFAQRYSLVHQRLLRQDVFRPKLVSGAIASGGKAAEATVVLTPIESLLGRPGIRTLLGIIVQVEEGRYYLEDLTAQIPLDLSQCQVLSAGYITENCIMLLEGEFIDGIFHATKIGHPPSEPRWTSIVESVGYSKSDVFEAIPSESELNKLLREEERHGAEGMFVILSDVHLDNPQVMAKLEKLFDGYTTQHSANVSSRLPIFVFMGNFTSKPFTANDGVQQVTSVFDDLADLISKFRVLAEEAKFIFLPGPNDLPMGNVLPRGPIPRIFTGSLRSKVRHLAFASNPCRIRFFTKEIVLFRQSTVNKLAKYCILPPLQGSSSANDDDDDVGMSAFTQNSTTNKTSSIATNDRVQHAIKTLLDQGHLSPLPLTSQPIYWQYDHALRLFPLPDAVILADSAGVDPFCRSYLDCTAVNPGSFPIDFSFVVFYPVRMSSRPSDMDYDGDNPKVKDYTSAIEFSQVD